MTEREFVMEWVLASLKAGNIHLSPSHLVDVAKEVYKEIVLKTDSKGHTGGSN